MSIESTWVERRPGGYADPVSEIARQASRRLSEAAASGEVAGLCGRARIELLVMFGSAAHDDTDPNDVDLAVRFERGADGDVLGLLEALYELTGYEGFDLLDLGRAGPVARERALIGVRVLHEARPGLFAREQLSAIMERLDTDEMRRVELELMSR
ncbi:MAG: nucleotidyltransferase family protein [Nocardioides sp.]